MFQMNNFRQIGTTVAGRSFNESDVELVWSKGYTVPGFDPARLRKDRCGAWIQRNQYGQQTERGWEIDHDLPVARGGGDYLDNVQPLHWENNRHKGDRWPWSPLDSAVTAKT